MSQKVGKIHKTFNGNITRALLNYLTMNSPTKKKTHIHQFIKVFEISITSAILNFVKIRESKRNPEIPSFIEILLTGEK